MSDQPKRPAPDVWDDSVAPGGYVCGVCGVPTEDEACAAHQERGTWWEVAQFRPPPDMRPPVEQTQLPPGSRPVQPEPTAYQRGIAQILTAIARREYVGALRDAAASIEGLRKENPMNGDGWNLALDTVISGLDRLAGNDEPSQVAKHEREGHRREREERYLQLLAEQDG